MKKMRRRPDFLMEQNGLQARLVQQNAAQTNFFDRILITISENYQRKCAVGQFS